MISTGHLWLIGILLIVVLIIWGPGKLPDVGAGLGRAIREFRHASTTTRDEFNKATRADDAPAAAAPVAAATPLSTETPAPVATPVGAAPVTGSTEAPAGERDQPAAG